MSLSESSPEYGRWTAGYEDALARRPSVSPHVEYRTGYAAGMRARTPVQVDVRLHQLPGGGVAIQPGVRSDGA